MRKINFNHEPRREHEVFTILMTCRRRVLSKSTISIIQVSTMSVTEFVYKPMKQKPPAIRLSLLTIIAS